MKKIVKLVLGIDVAQGELVTCLSGISDDWEAKILGHRNFTNTKKGFEAMILWVKQMTDGTVQVRYVMEATGVYHQSLAYFIEAKGYEVSIVLPNKISSYGKSLDVKTITDKTSSEAIARFGLERKLDLWQQPKKIFLELKQLTRERDQIVDERTMAKNQLHAEETEAFPNKNSVARIKARIRILNKQEAEIKTEISCLVKTDEGVAKSVKVICTIPGVALLTAAIVLAETNGFEMIRSRRQLTSYAGLDIKEKQSGTSVNGKPRISKQGNKHLRKAMHMPALSAIRHGECFRAVYVRLVSKHGIKMKGAVAVQRKLLELIYTVHKTNTDFDKDFGKTTVVESIEQKQAA
jgi:transposase